MTRRSKLAARCDSCFVGLGGGRSVAPVGRWSRAGASARTGAGRFAAVKNGKGHAVDVAPKGTTD